MGWNVPPTDTQFSRLGTQGERGGSPEWLVPSSRAPKSLPSHGWALLIPWDLLTATHSPPVGKGEASNQGTIHEWHMENTSSFSQVGEDPAHTKILQQPGTSLHLGEHLNQSS